MMTQLVANVSSKRELNMMTQSSQVVQKNDSDANRTRQAFLSCSDNPDNLIDEATAEQVERIFVMSVLPLIELFGVSTNVINCLVFVRQGLKDRINLCLCSLAIADLGVLVLMFSAKFFSFLGLFDEDMGDYWSKKNIETILGPKLAMMNICNLMTMIISVERCICVVSPFTAKIFLKTRYMAVIIFIMAILNLGLYSVLNLKHVTVHVTDPATNTSRWLLRPNEKYVHHPTVISILYLLRLVSLVIPGTSLAVVIVTTSTTVSRLRYNLAWRLHSARKSRASAGDRREEGVTKMLLVVCLIYITTVTPSVTQSVFRAFVPGYVPSGKYCNLFTVIQTMTYLCDVTNSSVNFIVYFTMGTRFRDTVQQLFGTWRKKKESPAQRLPTVSQDM